MKYVGYIRVSKEDQQKSGLGLEAQREMLEVYAGRSVFKAPLVTTEEGEAVGGATPIEDRKGFQRALALLEPGDVLLVPRLDRLSRDEEISVDARRAVHARGCRIVSTRGEGTENDEPENVFLRLMLQAVAVFERLQTQKRTVAALAAKRARGEPVGRPPFGWRYRRKKLVPVPVEQVTLRWIIARAAEGWTSSRIAGDLNVSQVPPKSGARWGAGTVQTILEGVERRKSLGGK